MKIHFHVYAPESLEPGGAVYDWPFDIRSTDVPRLDEEVQAPFLEQLPWVDEDVRFVVGEVSRSFGESYAEFDGTEHLPTQSVWVDLVPQFYDHVLGEWKEID